MSTLSGPRTRWLLTVLAIGAATSVALSFTPGWLMPLRSLIQRETVLYYFAQNIGEPALCEQISGRRITVTASFLVAVGHRIGDRTVMSGLRKPARTNQFAGRFARFWILIRSRPDIPPCLAGDARDMDTIAASPCPPSDWSVPLSSLVTTLSRCVCRALSRPRPDCAISTWGSSTTHRLWRAPSNCCANERLQSPRMIKATWRIWLQPPVATQGGANALRQA